MDVFLSALADAGPSPDSVSIPAALSAQVTQWGKRAQHDDLGPAVLFLALVFWSRLHGLISLEIDHHLQATGIDPELLFTAEIDHLVDTAVGSAAPPAE